MKKILIFVLLVTVNFPFLSVSNMDDSSLEKIEIEDKINYHLVEEDIIIFANIKDVSLIEKAKGLISPNNIVIIYDLEDDVVDLLYNQEYKNTFAYIYYYNSLGTLVRMRISGENLSKKSKEIELKNHLNLNYEKYELEKIKKEKIKLEKLSKGEELNKVTNNNFEVPKFSFGGTDIHSNYSYIVHEHLVYRNNIGDNYIFRVESKVQFTSGKAAVESGYDKSYKSNYAIIKGELFKYIASGYGVWESAQPKRVDYFPKNEPSYRTITSGFNLNLTLGRTDVVGAEIGSNGFGVQASSKLSSNVGLGYFYQETRTVSVPDMNALWLSQTEGAAWEFIEFETSPDKSVTVYPGMLFETIPATPYPMRFNGEYHINIHFKTKKQFIFNWYQNQYVEEIILLDFLF